MTNRRRFFGKLLGGAIAVPLIAQADASHDFDEWAKVEPMKLIASPNGQPITGMVQFDGRLFVAAGPDLFELSPPTPENK